VALSASIYIVTSAGIHVVRIAQYGNALQPVRHSAAGDANDVYQFMWASFAQYLVWVIVFI